MVNWVDYIIKIDEKFAEKEDLILEKVRFPMQLCSTAGRAAAQWHNCGPHECSQDCIVVY